MTVSPMFPLGTVLFPHGVLPLHVFEPRYRQLTADCLGGDRRFGVVLIERGSEVGGGDERFEMGTMAEIVESSETPDGRWLLVAAGRERCRVVRWLPDDPYPRAEVEVMADDGEPADEATLRDAEQALRRYLALAAEAGVSNPLVLSDLASDRGVRGWQLCSLAPLGPVDRYRLLTTARAGERVALLAELLADARELLAFRLGRAQQ